MTPRQCCQLISFQQRQIRRHFRQMSPQGLLPSLTLTILLSILLISVTRCSTVQAFVGKLPQFEQYKQQKQYLLDHVLPSRQEGKRTFQTSQGRLLYTIVSSVHDKNHFQKRFDVSSKQRKPSRLWDRSILSVFCGKKSSDGSDGSFFNKNVVRLMNTNRYNSKNTSPSSIKGSVRVQPLSLHMVTVASSSTPDQIETPTTSDENNVNGLSRNLSTITKTPMSISPSGKTMSTSTIPFWKILWQFTRPHTIVGSALAIPALHLMAVPTSELFMGSSVWIPTLLKSTLYAVIPALLMNLYITGLNQITDVEIDRINKPDLPIAAGLLTIKSANIIVVLSLVLSLWMGNGFQIGSVFNPPLIRQYATQGLNVALWGSGILGTLYSIEPIRFKKRHPLLAALCIVAVRGFIINASFYAHAKSVMVQSLAGATTAATAGGVGVLQCLFNDPVCWYSSLFFGMFGIVIALMKDVPDVIGDAISNVRTFSVRIGPGKILKRMSWFLQATFLTASLKFLHLAYTAVYQHQSIWLVLMRLLTSVSAANAAMSVRINAKHVNPTDPKQVYTFYMHLWKLFYASYFILPFAR